jgi:tetratricopeptide (TPR) repeat protein
VELARIYTILGQLEKANRAIDAALKLAPENRFTVRSAARFFVHVDDPEKAEWILKKSQRVHVDPWLLSTHISIAQLQDKAFRFGREASSMVNSGSHAPLHVVELAAVLGNVELANGEVKNARRLFQKSLVKPTENAVAQVVTVARLIARAEYLKSEFHVQRPFEAKAKAHVFLAEWDRVFAECKLWLCDEPFSTEPALLGSYISSCLTNDFEKALSILEKALRANPSDPALLNNKAFSLIESNQLKEAKNVLGEARSVGSGSASSVALKATEGLLEYRSGNPIRGAVLYGLAADLAKTSQNLRSQILVELFHGRERIRVAPAKAEEIVSQIEPLVRKSADPDIPFLMKKLTEQGGVHRRDSVNQPSNRKKKAGGL